ncbi:hypothetical protein QN277_007349 [Acacia crassicarpa]|uniref:Protein kinase domain-containing protein n=1 Tax=Acacia crassicarpa TaxID=499986 RepID=A0AAE1IUE3_9FABA|nr:hypothetical protein QN277_007346 [Acacia crassicarpa]KAK4257811.1 hypothetical protein QN277_007349 [Acacia crassicarpa]
MIWHHRFLLSVMSLLWVLLQTQGNGEDQQVHLPPIPDALQGLNFSVSLIYNESIFIYAALTDPEGCLARLILQRRLYNLSIIHPFEYAYGTEEDIVTFFNCSSIYDSGSCPILALGSQDSVLPYYNNLTFCTNISRLRLPVPTPYLRGYRLDLEWKIQPKIDHKTSIILSSTGSIVLLLLLVVCFCICRYLKHKGEDQVRLETFLKDFQALKPTRFSYAAIKRITHKFKDKLGEGAHGTVFKGKLSNEIQVAVKVLDNSDYDGKDFINEMGTMGKIHHINVVRLLGFCADGCRRALVYDFFSNGSLQKFISSPNIKEIFLGWSKLQQIAVDIAKGIEYLHQGCDHRILHFDINPRNVLLDNNFTPKISDFGLAKLCSKDQSNVSITAAKGTLGYIAPEVFSRNFGNVSYKSDIYSYGMLLLEMVGGRKNVDTNQVLYPEWIHNLIEGGDVSIYIEDEVDIGIAKKLAIVGLWCIQWHSINRPSIKTVVQMLEGEVDKLKVPPTPFDFTTSTNINTVIPIRNLNLELDVIHELE